ncbi:class F sortase [Dactylosporangium sp. NPDC051484]|uniref:class F sortase n=1 Tax=Dactylosporangium sp. NPDC051484 TaxID=3154942 RepID=UPI00344CE9C2
MGESGRVLRHRAPRRRLNLTAARRRTPALIGCVLALAAPVYIGAATLIGRRVGIDAGGSTWIVPHRIDLAAPDAEPGAPPTRLRIPSLAVDTALETLRMDGSGVLSAPEVYGEAGWFAGGTVPGEPGPAVLAGHVDSKTGPAVFYRLHELKPGDTVDVRRGLVQPGEGGWLTFRVTASEHYAKARFPSAKVYGPTPVPELRLITCGGTFDESSHSYRDNLVVYAVLQ